jgi:hypothetical protein
VRVIHLIQFETIWARTRVLDEGQPALRHTRIRDKVKICHT